ncbi:MAG TPA: thiamine pyrophosphate-dependent dehydrogenase E1 component subunit alpha [Roseimicrobium sp.]|nr:thiamine pyrophosphate-dependent dehydrogenase E1 component subunit alpha [Roseimicrobium sp.]
MIRTAASTSPPEIGAAPDRSGLSFSKEVYLRAFRCMVLARTLDDKLAGLYRAGKIHGGVFLGRGQEALSAALGVQLKPGDVYAPLIRDGAGRIAFGEAVIDALRTCIGSPLGPMRGRDGNVHRGQPKDGYLAMISHLGAMISVVNGSLIGKRFQGLTGHIGAACIGEGGTSTGAFHEAMNQAAIEKLPLVMVVADNQYAYSTPKSRQFACSSLLDRAAGYGITGETVDGTRLGECLSAIGKAVERARAGGGPHMIVASLLRLCGHGEHDDAGYIDPALKTSALGQDCVSLAEMELRQQGLATAAEIDTWHHQAVREVEDALSIVQLEPQPDPYAEEWTALSTPRLRETPNAS